MFATKDKLASNVYNIVLTKVIESISMFLKFYIKPK